VRHVRARQTSAGFLVLAASIFLLAASAPLCAQFPIRQVPGRAVASGQKPVAGSQSPGATSPQNPPATGHRQPATSAPPLPAVARIVVPEKDGVSYGSGTLIDARGQFGLVISNWHVVRDAAGPITVEFPDGFKSPAEVIKTDKDWDLAALSIYRPRATPLPITAAPPQPGDSLTIAGFGSGDWRMAGGRCTQYLAPGVEFPHELVELSAEARQGDSGGPILNDRGEMAGVLFGSGPGYTSGSYGGRVLKFLATVVPGGAPGNDGLPANSLPGDRAVATAERGPPRPDTYPVPVAPQATVLHENKPPSMADSLTPVLKPTSDPLLSPPPPSEVASRFGPSTASLTSADVDPRVAVNPSRMDLSMPPLPNSGAPFDISLSGDSDDRTFAGPRPAPLGGGPGSSNDQLLLQVWQRFGGETLFDQTKAVLAIIGLLSLVIVFVRFGSAKEREHEDE
jgi:hypothetical protein